MAQDNETSLSPDYTGFINPLVSQLSVDPYVDMDFEFANVLAKGHVCGDSGSLSPLFDMASAQCSDIHRWLTIPLTSQL